MVEKHLKIGPAAKLLGVSVGTLRNWSKTGFLVPAYIGPGRIRYYSVADIEGLLNRPTEQLQPEGGED